MVKFNSFLMQSLNNLFESIGYNKRFINNPVLNELEEMQLVGLFDKKLAQRYEVFAFEEE